MLEICIIVMIGLILYQVYLTCILNNIFLYDNNLFNLYSIKRNIQKDISEEFKLILNGKSNKEYNKLIILEKEINEKIYEYKSNVLVTNKRF